MNSNDNESPMKMNGSNGEETLEADKNTGIDSNHEDEDEKMLWITNILKKVTAET